MSNPDPVRASFEAWARQSGWAFDLWRSGDNSYTQPRDELAWQAYRAASKVSELEREYLEAALACEDWNDNRVRAEDDPMGNAIDERYERAKEALRLHRTPPKVDRVKAARDKLNECDRHPGGFIQEAIDLLTAELEARGKP